MRAEVNDYEYQTTNPTKSYYLYNFPTIVLILFSFLFVGFLTSYLLIEHYNKPLFLIATIVGAYIYFFTTKFGNAKIFFTYFAFGLLSGKFYLSI